MCPKLRVLRGIPLTERRFERRDAGEDDMAHDAIVLCRDYSAKSMDEREIEGQESETRFDARDHHAKMR